MNSAKDNPDEFKKYVPIAQMLELQLKRDETSVERFVIEDGKAQPQFQELEGYLPPLIDEAQVYGNFHDGALTLVGCLQKSFGEQVEIAPSAACRNMERLSLEPTLKEAELWGDSRNAEKRIAYFAKPASLLSYILHPSDLQRDRFVCRWRVGFLRRLLKVPLPYAKILDVMTRMYHKHE